MFILAANLVDALHKYKMLNFVLVSFISSDSILCKEDALKSLDALKNIEDELNSSSLSDKVKKGYQDRICKCYDILNAEIKRYDESKGEIK